MERKIRTWNTYTPDPGHKPIGVSKTVPRLSLSVSELVKRFTLTTLKEMEAKSLLTYDFTEEEKRSDFDLLDKVDLSVASCIDFTDVQQLHEEAQRQMSIYREAMAKQKEENEKAIKAKQDAARQSLIDEAKRQILSENSAKVV